jgi:hypothetical protein
LKRRTSAIATCTSYTVIEPYFKPENYFEVRQALIEAGRADLIGGCDGLIPAQPPKEALARR